MRKLGFRAVRIAVVAIAAWAGYVLLAPYGLGWVVLPAALVLVLVGTAVAWWRVRRMAAQASPVDVWASAVLDGPRRPKAIREVRAAIAQLGAPGAMGAARRAEHARLGIVLAELLDADGRPAEAREVLDAIDLGAMEPLDAAMVRHARAVVQLRAGEAQAALDGLRARPPRSGDRELDARLELLEAAAQVELGQAEEAMNVATRVRKQAGDDADLAAEARVVRAAALDALGRRDEAIGILRTLDDAVVDALAQLGHPRVRSLAAAARSEGS